MGKAIGYTCDQCSAFATRTKNDGDAPNGWFKLTLPRTIHDTTPATDAKDLCSSGCVEKFGKAKRQAEAGIDSVSGNGQGKGKGNGPVDPRLVVYLEKRGYVGRQRGPVIANHSKHANEREFKEGCNVCDWQQTIEPIDGKIATVNV